MAKPIVLFLDVPFEGLNRDQMPELERHARVVSAPRVSPDEMAAARREAVGCVARAAPITGADLDAMPMLRLVSAWGVGFNHVDVAAATARNIPVCVNPVFTRSMAEAGITLILALSKRLTRHMKNAKAGVRSPDSDRGMEIRGKILGIVGFGRIGRELGDLVHRLDMAVVAYDPFLPPAAYPTWSQALSLPELLRAADFVVVTAPLTPETHHLMGAEQFALMKPSAYLINIARGPLVDETALLAALTEGRIAGAGLDVWEQEPVRPDHPLLALENVTGTPHRLGATVESLQALCGFLQANLLRVLRGERPENAVNPEVFQGESR
jgi:phosphoglycerate dehydrogenase-like enzyme